MTKRALAAASTRCALCESVLPRSKRGRALHDSTHVEAGLIEPAGVPGRALYTITEAGQAAWHAAMVERMGEIRYHYRVNAYGDIIALPYRGTPPADAVILSRAGAVAAAIEAVQTHVDRWVARRRTLERELFDLVAAHEADRAAPSVLLLATESPDEPPRL